MTIENDKVFQAVKTLRLLNEKTNAERKASDLFGDPGQEHVYLQISMKKIPFLRQLQSHKIKLPYPHMTDLSDVCLLTCDLDRKKPDDEKTVAHFTDILRKSGISVGQIIPFHALRTEYKTFESRRHLARCYERFLNDSRITNMMTDSLGTFFIRKKKMPTSVSLTTGKLKDEFMRALSKTQLLISGHGSTCTVKVGVLDQTDDELINNIWAIANYLEVKMPGKWANIQSVHLKTKLSLSIPVYLSFDSANNVVLPLTKFNDQPVEDELTTLTRSRVQVYPSGKIKLVKVAADDIENEIVDLEKKMLADQRYSKNKEQKKKELLLKNELKMERKKMKAYRQHQKQKLKKKMVKKEVPKIKSMFGFSKGGEMVTDGTTKKKTNVFDPELMNETLSPDKSFEDSFRVQKLRARLPATKAETETESKAKVEERAILKENPTVGRGDRKDTGKNKSFQLTSVKRSYSMLANEKTGTENKSTELLSYKKRSSFDSTDGQMMERKGKRQKNKEIENSKKNGKAITKDDKVIAKGEGMDKGKAKTEKKLSRFNSIRQSVRLAKKLM